MLKACEMSYKHTKELTALLSVVSTLIAVITAIIAAGSANHIKETTEQWSPLITGMAAILAGLAAYISIAASRRLKREREQGRVFLIYAREDLDAARKIATVLRENGFRPWLDVDEISPGEFWQKSIMDALERSAAALVLVSRNLTKEGFVQKEIKAALDRLQEQEAGVSPIIPVRLDATTVPNELSRIQWVDFFTKGGKESLLNGLSRITRRYPQHAEISGGQHAG
jgi:phosphate/sulfate permease